MKYRIEIEVDTNDGDYATDCYTTDEKGYEKALYMAKKLKDLKEAEDSYHYDTAPKEMYNLTDDEEEEFSDFFHVSCEYGFHTIESIKIFPFENCIEIDLDKRWNKTW